MAALLSLLVLLSGCGGVQRPSAPVALDNTSFRPDEERLRALESALADLGPDIDRIEARRVAETALRSSAALARDYRLVKPAVFHNLLIQMGLRDRGLCYHWTEDLMRELERLALKSFHLYWGVAHRGSNLREHNSVVITASDQVFEQGLVLDPWRDSGNLYWVAVVLDDYPWEALPPGQW